MFEKHFLIIQSDTIFLQMDPVICKRDFKLNKDPLN
jgi:hypothetical protein